MPVGIAHLDGAVIRVDGNDAGFTRIPGAKRRGGIWEMPATLDTCTELKLLRVPFTKELSDFGNRLYRIQRYIEHVKLQTDNVEPLQPIPIKAPYSLYQHQVKAYNIALALFGRGARKKDGDVK